MITLEPTKDLLERIKVGEEYDVGRIAGLYCAELCEKKSGPRCALCYAGIGMYPTAMTLACPPIGIYLWAKMAKEEGGLQKIIASAMMPEDIVDKLKAKYESGYRQGSLVPA